jgi:L-iditol 2-dehydrogenase
MKALVVQKPGKLEIAELENPVPGAGEVLAKVLHCGICATDYAIASGNCNLGKGLEPIYPVRIGHEWAGQIVETGKGTRYLKKGDRIISDTGVFCGRCEMCLRGERQSCLNGRSIGTIGNCWPGALAEYMLIPEHIAYRIPDNVASDEAALVEPSGIGFYGLTRASIGPGKNLLVIGTGPVSFGGMACAKGAGAGKTILAGRKSAKLDIGKKLGADITVNMEKENLFDAVMQETGGLGTDIVLDSTGAADIFNLSVSLVRPSGTLVIPGFYEQPLNNIAIDNITARNLTLIGAAGTPDMPRQILDMISNGHVDLKPMITDRFSFSDVEAAVWAVKERNDTRIKIMIDF